jgi:hypothetical protein
MILYFDYWRGMQEFHSEICWGKLPSPRTAQAALPQVARRFFAAPSSPRFPELELFRQQIELNRAGLYHQPYSNNKFYTRIYKAVFFGFSLLFVLLSVITFKVSFAFSWGIFNFQAIGLAKTAIVSLCMLFAFSALTIAFSIRTEREAIYHCVRRARMQLSRSFAQKRIQCRSGRLLGFTQPKREINASIRQTYRESWHRINDRKEEALHLVQRIASAKTIHWNEKEMLMNQAIEELHEKLFLLVHSFKISAHHKETLQG